MIRFYFLHSMALAALLVGCSSGDGSSGMTTDASSSSSSTSSASSSSSTSGGGGAGGGSAAEDLNMTEADFECVLNWTLVNRFRITNKLGHQSEAIAVANSTTGGKYPVGTVIQLIPEEAMVKRRAGFSAETQDWEFFFLGAKDKQTTIKTRGTTDVLNGFGLNCLDCHSKAMPQWNLVCEQTHGCDPLPVTADQIKQAQEADPRCVP